MKIVHISAECYPLAKVGGLADVVGALPKYINKTSHEACVVLPKYATAAIESAETQLVFSGRITLAKKHHDYKIHRVNDFGFPAFLISIPELFDRPNVYSYPDDTERFTAFQIAFLDWLTQTEQHPDIIHCHDH
ncbi:MAG: glycogen/starch synthase, partial [Flavobacterium sp.]|nr:glycogen/starch synthase [Flavobacterium sp.]